MEKSALIPAIPRSRARVLPLTRRGEDGDCHGASAGDDGGHCEHAGTDDAADDESGGRGHSQDVALFLIRSKQASLAESGLRGAR